MMPPTIVFMGTPDFAVPSLQALLRHSVPVAAAVTAPDKPQGRGQKLAPSPVKEVAAKSGLRILQPLDLRDPTFAADLASLHADLFVVVAFRILPQEVFTLPRLGSFNLHASLLPKYRGAAPINRAIMNGESETGVTTFLLQNDVDAGSVLLQEKVQIGEDETAGELRERLSVLGADVVVRTVQLLEAGAVMSVPQDPGKASFAPKIFKEDCWIDWSGSTRTVHNFVRGLSPLPSAMTRHRSRLLKIFRTRIPAADEAGEGWQRFPSGSVAIVGKRLMLVRTGDGLLAIEELQQEGRKRMKIEEFLRGTSFGVGDQLSTG